MSVGVLTASVTRGKPGGDTMHFRRLVRLGEHMGIPIFVYSLKPNGTLETYAWNASGGGFTEIQMKQLPRVLYNRIPTRRLEQTDWVTSFKTRFSREGRILTNPNFLYKDELARIWSRAPELSANVPVSLVSPTVEEALLAFREYPVWYLKPAHGKAGMGIKRLQCGAHSIGITHQEKGRTRISELRDELMVRAFWRSLPARFVLQREANTLTIDGCRVDVRMLMHRDLQDGFTRSGAGVRIGPRDGITTHVPNGGRLAALDKTLHELYGRRSEEVNARIEKVVQSAARALELGCGGIWCELSFDLGLAPEGTPILFEANAKPMKFDETKIETEGKMRLLRTLQHIAES
ncbi:YheC/YheD family protein [Ferroacidibacillus organovorans]|uniref:ATP-grasp domain-containing protein n=1 Tax=Ferroacidibacillus organovorans TaxID=1765683 RepID=A0A853KB03_9BACL|nr:YheC/YheD family protein [Ferroacidibacillus organovorans]KYP82168.1 hypothetical protein AYJ22_00500 [Ferroacidibacillus organovorans]OAG93588.1 hypothetical protein AYW79_09885 [Ferroacidibacillus organovorans]